MTSPAPDDTPTTDPYTGQDMRFGGDKAASLREAISKRIPYSWHSDTCSIWNSDACNCPTLHEQLDSIVAAIAAYYEGLIPEKHGTTSYDYWQGHDDAIDTIRRNFKGGRSWA